MNCNVRRTRAVCVCVCVCVCVRACVRACVRVCVSCLLVGVLANTPGGVKRSGLGAHAVGFLVVY